MIAQERGTGEVYMSTELIGILATSVALGSVLFTAIRGIRQDLRRVEDTLRADITKLREDMNAGNSALRKEMSAGDAALREAIRAGDTALRDTIQAVDTARWRRTPPP